MLHFARFCFVLFCFGTIHVTFGKNNEEAATFYVLLHLNATHYILGFFIYCACAIVSRKQQGCFGMRQYRVFCHNLKLSFNQPVWATGLKTLVRIGFIMLRPS